MSKILKYIMIGSMALLLTNCASNTYKIKKEKDKQVLKVPSWYMNDYSTKKECGTTRFGRTSLKSVYSVWELQYHLT